MNKQIKIGIADDHLVLRQGFISLLKEFDEMEVLIDVSNGKELLEELKKNKPDIILLDIEMPVMNGREALEKIKIRYPKIKVIIMSMHFNDAYIIEFIKNGARAFLPKNYDIDKIVDAIHAVNENGYYYDSKVSAAMAELIKRNPMPEDVVTAASILTQRELEIIRLMCLKKSTTEVAEVLYLSPRTVEGHRLNIYKKLNINKNTDLIEYALSNKLV